MSGKCSQEHGQFSFSKLHLYTASASTSCLVVVSVALVQRVNSGTIPATRKGMLVVLVLVPLSPPLLRIVHQNLQWTS